MDGTPIREYRNREAATGVPFPTRQPMRVYASLWDAEGWATQGGRVKTDWSHAPFSASYRGYKADACVVVAGGRTRCGATVGEEVALGTGAAPAAGAWYNQAPAAGAAPVPGATSSPTVAPQRVRPPATTTHASAL